MTAMAMSAVSNHHGFQALDEPDAAWYLVCAHQTSRCWLACCMLANINQTGQQEFIPHSWAEQDVSHFNTTAGPSEHVWALSSHSQAHDFNSSNFQPAFAEQHLNPYRSPPASIVDFMQNSPNMSHSRSYGRNPHAQHDSSAALQIDQVRAASHSPSMLTTMSMSSGSESPYATPPPPPAAASILRSAAAAQGNAAAASVASRPSNRRRSTAPTTLGGKKDTSVATNSTIDKARERRSGHSAVERKYRENLNGKIEVLRQVLIDAHRSYDVKAQAALSRQSYSYSRTQGGREFVPSSTPMARTPDCRGLPVHGKRDGYPPPDSVVTFAATIGSKKSDVLSSAIHYIKEAEQSRSVLMQQVAFLQGQVVKLESIMSGNSGMD